MKIAEKLFGTHSDRELKIVNPIVDKIEAMRDSMMALSDEELRDKTKEYKKRLEEGETLDDTASGGICNRSEERARRVTGHGALPCTAYGWCGTAPGTYCGDEKPVKVKTLVSTLPAYLNALDRKRCTHRYRQ